MARSDAQLEWRQGADEHVLITLSLLVASFVHVSLRAFQNLNVVNSHWLRVAPTGLGIAVAEVVVVGGVVSEGFAAVLPMAVGGIAGCWAAMSLHRKLGHVTDDDRASQRS